MLYQIVAPIYPADPPSYVKRLSDSVFIPFDTANTDYQQFKAQILAGDAQLETADGTLMTPEEAKAFVETLP